MSAYDNKYFNGIEQGPYRGYDTPYKRISLNRYLNRLDAKFTIRRDERVLDIGCAYGLFLKLLEERGAKAYGMDISEHAIERARENSAGDLVVGDADEPLPYPDSFFRLVTLFDVLEHLTSPNRTLTEIHRVIEPGGLLALTTVNAHAASRFLKYSHWTADKDPTHLYIFDRFSLRFLLERAGFRVLSTRTPLNSLPDWLSGLLESTGLGGQIFAMATPEKRQ